MAFAKIVREGEKNTERNDTVSFFEAPEDSLKLESMIFFCVDTGRASSHLDVFIQLSDFSYIACCLLRKILCPFRGSASVFAASCAEVPYHLATRSAHGLLGSVITKR